MKKKPHRGCIAVCSNGSLGLITSNTKVPIPFDSQPDYSAWTGIQISPSVLAVAKSGRVVGDSWCSSNPTVIFTAIELRKMADKAFTVNRKSRQRAALRKKAAMFLGGNITIMNGGKVKIVETKATRRLLNIK